MLYMAGVTGDRAPYGAIFASLDVFHCVWSMAAVHSSPFHHLHFVLVLRCLTSFRSPMLLFCPATQGVAMLHSASSSAATIAAAVATSSAGNTPATRLRSTSMHSSTLAEPSLVSVIAAIAATTSGTRVAPVVPTRRAQAAAAPSQCTSASTLSALSQEASLSTVMARLLPAPKKAHAPRPSNPRAS